MCVALTVNEIGLRQPPAAKVTMVGACEKLKSMRNGGAAYVCTNQKRNRIHRQNNIRAL